MGGVSVRRLIRTSGTGKGRERILGKEAFFDEWLRGWEGGEVGRGRKGHGESAF